MDYLDLFIVQTHMLKSHFKGHRTKIDNENIKYEVESDIWLECNSSSGEIKFGNLVHNCIKPYKHVENKESQD